MYSHIIDWVHLSLRWFHFITGIAWIGSSFYFMWLDSAFEPLSAPKKGVDGSLWMVHGGNFYYVEKMKPGPGEVPKKLHWFYWEAYLTWISGILLLSVLYYLTGGVYLLDSNVSNISAPMASVVGIGILAISWVLYDALYTSKLGDHKILAPLLSFLYVGMCVYGLTHLLSGRAAYIHIGALFGTLMVANVWIRIIPAQRKMFKAIDLGEKPDFELGVRAKRRSTHNSYMTFPVLFIMLSNHFPSTYGNQNSWIILCLLIFVGAGIRHTMISKSEKKNLTFIPVGIALAILIYLTAPASLFAAKTANNVSFTKAREIINNRCIQCHSSHPTDDVFKVAPANVMYDTPEQIKSMAERILVRSVDNKTMPLANKTQMTDNERELLGRWVRNGAQLE